MVQLQALHTMQVYCVIVVVTQFPNLFHVTSQKNIRIRFYGPHCRK
jgi:hypothetical protein